MKRKLTEKALLARDAGRDLDAELRQSVRDLRAGRLGRVTVMHDDGTVVESPVTRTCCANSRRPDARARRVSSLDFALLHGLAQQRVDPGLPAIAARAEGRQHVTVQPQGW